MRIIIKQVKQVAKAVFGALESGVVFRRYTPIGRNRDMDVHNEMATLEERPFMKLDVNSDCKVNAVSLFRATHDCVPDDEIVQVFGGAELIIKDSDPEDDV